MKPRRLYRVALFSVVLMLGSFVSSMVWARSATNIPPVISGTPLTAIEAGHFYSFRPQASDANGDRLTFSISNKPGWATFDRRTGRLSGTPTASNIGTYVGIRIRVSDRVSIVSLPSFNVTVTGSAPANTPPVIFGSPATSVRAGNPYSFVPSASDVDGNALVFSILNKPAWALFNSTTGALSGTPTSAYIGTTTGITIQVSDGTARASLAPFDLTVLPTSYAATINWIAPSVRDDGTALALSEIAGYRIYHGPVATQLTLLADYPDPTATQYTVRNLGQGTHYFAVSVYDTAGLESPKSAPLYTTLQ